MDVLILSVREDIHAAAVAREVELLGGRAIVIDSGDFPARCALVYSREGSFKESILEHYQLGSIELDSIGAVWWRRPTSFDVSAHKHPSLADFVFAESSHAFIGTLVSAVPCFVNPIVSSRQASLKPLQLHAAQKLGLKIPDTLITTDSIRAEKFVRARGRKCIYKTLTSPAFGLYETRRLEGAEDLADLWRIRDSPVIIQEYIGADFDVRAVVVDDEVFAGKILHIDSDELIDSRLSRASVQCLELPESIYSRLVALVRHFGLRYAAIDLRCTGVEYTFLELNPEGQFLWIEIGSGLPISASLARLLCCAAAV